MAAAKTLQMPQEDFIKLLADGEKQLLHNTRTLETVELEKGQEVRWVGVMGCCSLRRPYSVVATWQCGYVS